MKYRKKPVVIEAIQWTGENKQEIRDFVGDKVIFTGKFKQAGDEVSRTWLYSGLRLEIDTLEGTLMANINDYIIKGVHGEFYPCKPDIFAETYELVE